MGFSTTVKVAMWITVLAFFLEAVGFAIPFVFGIVISVGDTALYGFVGIWYMVSCVKGKGIDSCVSQAIAQNLGSSKPATFDGKNVTSLVDNGADALGTSVAWLVFQIIMTVGVGMCLLAFLVILCSACYRTTSKGWFIFACIMLFFSALIILGMIGLFIAAMALVFVFLSSYGVATAENFPWSLLILGIGAILSLIASIIFMVITCNWSRHKYQDSDTESEHEVPMTDIQKEGYENRGYDPRNAPPDYNGYPSQYDRPYGQSYVQSQVHPSNYGSSQYDKPYVKYPSQSDNMYRPYSQHKY